MPDKPIRSAMRDKAGIGLIVLFALVGLGLLWVTP